ncbi:hypothetical protein PV325_005264 [Microctonus aethiopoides]|nr:hypothetical protein PV325_005264 [Microctonus aethiopoides]
MENSVIQTIHIIGNHEDPRQLIEPTSSSHFNNENFKYNSTSSANNNTENYQVLGWEFWFSNMTCMVMMLTRYRGNDVLARVDSVRDDKVSYLRRWGVLRPRILITTSSASGGCKTSGEVKTTLVKIGEMRAPKPRILWFGQNR